MAPILGPLSGTLETLGTLPDDQRAMIQAMASEARPGLALIYGFPERIVLASSTEGGLFSSMMNQLSGATGLLSMQQSLARAVHQVRPSAEPGRYQGIASPMSAVIELDGLGVRFGRRPILKELRGSLSGRAIGLLGPNGAGKTTLIHTLLGFHSPTEGTARIFGNISATIARRSAPSRATCRRTTRSSPAVGGAAGASDGRAERAAPASRRSSAPTRPCSTSGWAKRATATSRPTRWA